MTASHTLLQNHVYKDDIGMSRKYATKWKATRLLSLQAALLAALSTNTAFAASLVMELNPTTQQDVFSINVDTSMLTSFHISKPRSLAPDDAIAIEPVCHQAGEHSAIEFDTEVSCDSISWKVAFRPVASLGLDIAEQVNRYDPKQGWYFFTEWDSLPTFQSADSTLRSQLCLNDLKNTSAQCFAVPSSSQAPLLLSWGLPNSKVTAGSASFELATNVEQVRGQQTQWLPQFEQQLNYLSQVFEDNQAIEWQMNIFGREVSSGNVSGAAGFSSINVNVPLENGRLSEKSYPHLLKILAHEAIHGLDQRDLPLWVNEGLAEYYAQKSLNSTSYSQPDAVKQWQAISERLPFASTGLIEANRAFVEDHQGQYMMLFYTKSVAFWQSLDEALAKHNQTLDEYVLLPIAQQDYQLTAQFSESISRVIGEQQWNELVAAYL